VTATSVALIFALLQGVTGLAPLADPSTSPRSSVIAVIVPSPANSPMVDALTRLRGEAVSVGFEIRLVESSAGVEPLGQLDIVAREIRPAAVVALVGNPDAERPEGASIEAIDVWFLDRTTGKTSVGHLSVDEAAGDRADLVLAVRVVDFIRARMFDSLVRNQALTREKRGPAAAHAPVGRRYLALGLLSTGSFAGFSPAYLPYLEIGYGFRPWLRLSLGAAGFGTQPRKVTFPTAGSAMLDEVLGTLSVSLVAPAWWRLLPYVRTGPSLFHLAVHGDGDSGYLGHDTEAWSPGWFIAAGFEVVLVAHVVFQVSGGALWLLHEPQVFIDGNEVARTGRPAWLGHALFGVSF
jgi:hypothetical protein